MDPHTLEILEFDKIRALVASRAACSLGKQRARALEPMRDVGLIRARQSLTTEMAEALAAGLTPPFGGLRDIRGGVRRARTAATLEADELAEVVETLRAIGNLGRWLERVGTQFPRLGGLRSDVGVFEALEHEIDGCLDPRGKVLDTASRGLSAVRREVAQAEERIQETLRRMLRSNEIKRILRYPNFTMVGHHYVLPIAKDHRGEIEGSVHRTSSSNETVYIEPRAIAEQSAQLSFLRTREAKEVRRVLRRLSAQVGQHADALLTTLEALAGLDLIFASGRYSLDYAMSPPDFGDDGVIALRVARHPLLEAVFRGEIVPRPRADVAPPAAPDAASAATPIDAEVVVVSPDAAVAVEPTAPRREVVPIDARLGAPYRIMVVTGPNTGGKTVALKTVGLLAVMAQAGLHIPAGEGSRLPVLDDVLADIGDEQSLEQSLSTFSSHVRRVSQIMAAATAKSLVLMDEMGAGTDPAEGAALGRAILDELDSIGCLSIVTTHIGDLKTYAFTNPRAENAAVEFDLETLRPLYHLRIGDIGQSNALAIARRLDLAEHVVARAQRYLDETRGATSPEIAVIHKLRAEAETARAAAVAAQAEAERNRDAARQRLTDLHQRDEDESRLAVGRERLQPGDRVVVPKLGFDRPGRVVKVDLKKRTALVAIGIMQWDVALDELIPQAPRGPEPTKRT